VTVDILRVLRASHISADLVNLGIVRSDELRRYRALLVPSGPFMERVVQERVAQFAEAGGRAVLVGAAPTHDEHLRPLGLLDRSHIERLRAAGLDELLGVLRNSGVEYPVRSGGPAAVWLWRHPTGAAHMFVLTATGQGGDISVNVDLDGHVLPARVGLPGGSGAIVRLDGGRPTALLAKGRNERSGETVAPYCEIDGYRIGADRPADVFIEARDGAILAYAAAAVDETVWASAGPVRVRALPIGH
jgi:beta-galactosidase